MPASPIPAAAAVALALLLGASACGNGAAEKPAATPTTSATTSAGPTDGPTSTGPPATTGSTSPANLPTDFPTADVPLVDGVVTAKTGGGGGPGKQGWVLEMSAAGSARNCFDRAAKALTDAGFVKRGDMVDGGNHQAQFTTDGYAVIISAEADGTDLCRLGYEVGEVSK